MKIEIPINREVDSTDNWGWTEKTRVKEKLFMCNRGILDFFGTIPYTRGLSAILTVRDRMTHGAKKISADFVVYQSRFGRCYSVSVYTSDSGISGHFNIPKRWYDKLVNRKILYLTFKLNEN